MRKIYFLIAILFISEAVQAQYSLDASNTNATTGDTYTLYKVIGTVDPGSSGADANWDFSGESTSTEITAEWKTADNATSPGIFYSDPIIGTVPNMQLSYDSSFYFYIQSSTGLQSRGMATNYGGAFGVYQIMPYDVVANVFTYPFDFGDETTNTLNFSYEYLKGSFPISGTVNGTLTHKYDAYGSITLPDGKFVSDVARIKITESYTKPSGGAGALSSVNSIYYEYREAFTPTWIAKIEDKTITITNGDIANRNNAYFVKGSQVQNVSELIENSNNISVYPNPTADFANISFYLSKRSDVLISVTDILGNETTIKQFFDASAGDYQERIDLNEFATGYYLIKLKINGEVQAQKIQKF